MNMHKTFILKYVSFFILTLTFMFQACKDEGIIGELEIENNQVILQAKGEPVKVEVHANTEWRIDFPGTVTWLTTDIRGGQSSRNYFMLTYDENAGDSERDCEIIVFTSDGKSESVINVKQLGRYPFITLGSSAMELFTIGGEYNMELTTNVPDTEIDISSTASWVKNIRISDGKLYFNTETNTEAPRTGVIMLDYKDQYNREASAKIDLSQAYSQYADATLVDYSTINAYDVGTVNDNVRIEGVIVADGTSLNFPKNRYVVQNEDGETVLFESENLIVFTRFDRISLSLKDGTVKEESEGSFTYKVVGGITAAHILSSEASTFEIPEKNIAELSNEMAFSLITLKDVEIASPVGAFTNFKTTDPGAADRRANNFYWVEKFPSYYRYFPVCIRDKDGSSTYMFTSLNASYAHETMPKGSGSITGIVMRTKLTNFDIDETQLCVVPLKRDDINISHVNEITNLLAEWNCDWPGTNFTKYHPTGGESSQSSAVLDKDGNQGFQRYYTENIIGFQDAFRGDMNLNVTNGNYGRATAGAFNSKPWSTNAYFYVDGISTVGISTSLSLQVEMNASWGGGPVMQVEYAYSMNGPWTVVEDSEFTVLGQFDRTAAQGQTEVRIPGFKVYDFKLPDALLNRENICIRLRPIRLPAGVGGYNPLRLGHLSIKYNK